MNRRPFFGLITIPTMTFCLGLASSSWEVSAQNSQDPNSNVPAQQDPAIQNSNAQQDQPRQDSPDERPVVTLPEGYVIPVRIADEISSKHDHPGEMFSGIVDPSVLVNDTVVIPRGTEAHIRMTHRKKGGHIHGKAEVTLELVSLILNGQRLEVDSDARTKKKGALEAKGAAVAKKGQSGGGGVLAGDPTAAAGPVIAAFSAAKVEVKAGSRIEFRLESPFTFQTPVNAIQP